MSNHLAFFLISGAISKHFFSLFPGQTLLAYGGSSVPDCRGAADLIRAGGPLGVAMF